MLNFKEQTFGVELEFTGMTRKKAAQTIAQTINGNFEYKKFLSYDKREITAADGRKWTIMSDSSIAGTGSRDTQCEFVTPICTYEDIETVQECIRALRKAGAKVNGSCGLHIHVGADKHTEQSLKNLAYTFRAKEDLIFKAIGTQNRRLGQWCRPIDDRLIHNIKTTKKLDRSTPVRELEDSKLKEVWYNTYAPGQSRSQHYNDSRYHALNFHAVWYHGTVEFRCFEATLHAGEVRAYINLVLAMSAAAINAKRASAEVLDNGNDKYAMRCWLLRLGFIGDEYKTVRQHLLKRLEGNAAWRNAPTTYSSYNAQVEARRAQRAAQ